MAVEVFTVPSTWGGYVKSKPVSPYRRIVGMSYDGGVSWAKAGSHQKEAQYNQAEATAEVIALNAPYDTRLIQFFDRYFNTEPHYPRPDAPPAPPEQPDQYLDEYNCHRLGYWMSGMVVAERLANPPAPDHIPEDGVAVTRNLRVGEHGVIGRGAAAVHSVVGLGLDTNECLQVLSTGGPIGVGTYDGALADYTADMKLYVRGF